jgi:hypothetical protein
MRKKHFVAVAQALKACRDSTAPASPQEAPAHAAAHDAMAEAVAAVLGQQSPTFNRVRFLHESGVNVISQKKIDATVFIVA